MPESDFSPLEFCMSDEENFETPASGPSIDIYDRNEIVRRLESDESESSYLFEESSHSQEESIWRRRLQALIRKHHSSRRRLLIADTAMIKRIGKLKETSPHFGSIIDLVERAAKLSHAAQSPLFLPPMLFIGSPGIGKTYFARKAAEALGTHLEIVAMDTLSDSFTLTGLSMSWKAARPGKVASALIMSQTASPIFLLDEIDKVQPINAYAQPLAFLHSVLEPENAARFTDEYYTFQMRADHAIWLLTANSIEGLIPSILDRLMIVHIDDPTRDQLVVVIKGIYARVNERFNNIFETVPSDAVVDRLIGMNPRNVRKVVEIAFGYANDQGLDYLSGREIDRARRLLDKDNNLKGLIGFL